MSTRDVSHIAEANERVEKLMSVREHIVVGTLFVHICVCMHMPVCMHTHACAYAYTCMYPYIVKPCGM